MHFKTLKKEFELDWKKHPAYTTVRNIIQGTCPKGIEACFRAYTQSLTDMGTTNTEICVAVDGKVLRGSFDNFEDKKAIQVLSFFETRQGLILTHE